MGFISDAWNVVTKVVGSSGGSTGGSTGLGGWGEVIRLGTTVGGAYLANRANERAAGAVTKSADDQIRFQREATERAIALFEDGRDRGLAALDRSHIAALEQLGIGEQQAQALYGDLIAATGAGFETFRKFAGEDPGQLTGAQQDAKRRLREDIQAGLAASNLRGAGRAGHAVTARALGEFENAAIEANRSRQFDAARALATANLQGKQSQITDATQRATQRANIETSRGSNEANLNTGFGTQAGAAVTGGAPAISRAVGDVGAAKAAADIASGNLTSDTLGKVGDQLRTFFRDDEKKERIDTDAITGYGKL